MSLISDQDYLRNDQYQQSNNLQARMAIHQRFSRNTYGWSRWVYDHLHIRAGMRILELGCGTGKLWTENLMRLPQSIQVTLADYSLGMACEARKMLGEDSRFRFMECDAQAIPLADRQFDLVVANHMLYHVPDIQRALAEVVRVLRPQGHLAAATNGNHHMREMHELMHQFDPQISITTNSAGRFGLENGDAQLAQHFPRRDMYIYDDALWITEAQPLVAYMQSLWWIGCWDEEMESRLEAMINTQIKEKGGIFIQKSTGLFWARQK